MIGSFDYLFKIIIVGDVALEKYKFLTNCSLEISHSNYKLTIGVNLASLKYLREKLEVIREKNVNIPIILVGCKLNLEKARQISNEDGYLFAKKFNLFSSVEISFNADDNLDAIIKNLAEIVIQNWTNLKI